MVWAGAFGAMGSVVGDVGQNLAQGWGTAGKVLSPGHENLLQTLRDLNGIRPGFGPAAVALGQVTGNLVGGGASFVPVAKDESQE